MYVHQMTQEDRLCTYKRNSEALSSSHCCRGKAISITYPERLFVAFGIQMQCEFAILSSVVCPALHYFSTFKQKELLDIKSVSLRSLRLFSEAFLILRRTERDIIKNVFWSSCKLPVIIVRV